MTQKRVSLPGRYEGFGEPCYPKTKVVSQYVHGADGTRLALDLIFPAGEDGAPAAGKFPTILVVSRNGRFERKNTGINIIEGCVPYGYVGAVLELRGCGASYGTNVSFSSLEDRKDVNTVIDWLIAQDWSDGQVATCGGSNRALIQFAAAVTRPAPSKGLKGITPIVANPDFYYQDYPNGISACPVLPPKPPEPKKTKEELLKTVAPVDEDPDGSMAYEAYETGQYGRNKNFMQSLLIPNLCRDDENPILDGEKTNLTIPPVSDLDLFASTGVRIHQMAGLLETGAFGQLMAAKEWGGSMVLGPWGHVQSSLGTGNPDIPEGAFDFPAEHRQWFDNLLKGVDNGFDQRPPFAYYVMNAEPGKRWRFSDTWPLATARPAVLYLTGEKSGTCHSVNDGSLSRTKPEQESTAAYKVDTSIQVFDNSDGKGATFNRMMLHWDGDMAPGVDQKALTFTTKPMFPPYRNEMVGNVSVELWVTCSQPDADFLVYLEEVDKTGKSTYISMGTIRASHRTEAPREAWNECGATYHPCLRADQEKCLEEGMDQPVCLRFAVEPACWHFAKGSRLRLTVTCANKKEFQHPMYDEANLPTIHLYQGGDYASKITVPFVEHEENVYNGTVRTADYEGPGTLYFFDQHVYLYYNGTWKRYDADAPELACEMKNGEAVYAGGFTFRLEGRPLEDGFIQDYQGGDPVVMPMPWKRHQVVDVMPVSAHEKHLFVPTVKTLYVEVFRENTEDKAPNPAVLYMHGYSRTPSWLGEQQMELLRLGYTVIGVDMRNYPPNIFPDYVYDMKGCIRYIRAHAAALRVDPDKLGCCGQSLGGNGTLITGVTAWEPELEGTVGGNLDQSSRLQAISVGYGWSDLLNFGKDLTEEYKDYPEDIRKMKFENTDGPTAPAAEVIGFSGPGKGLKVLRDYRDGGHGGEDPELDRMVKLAEDCSPVNHIAPDSPPVALFGGLGMVMVDIPYRQSERTFEQYQRYDADSFLFCNTNGRYGRTYPVVQGLAAFFDHYLRGEPDYPKAVLKPGATQVVENNCDRQKGYAPLVEQEGRLYISPEYLEGFFGEKVPGETVAISGRIYLPVEALEGSALGFRYYEDKDMAAVIPYRVIAENQPQKRNN